MSHGAHAARPSFSKRRTRAIAVIGVAAVAAMTASILPIFAATTTD